MGTLAVHLVKLEGIETTLHKGVTDAISTRPSKDRELLGVAPSQMHTHSMLIQRRAERAHLTGDQKCKQNLSSSTPWNILKVPLAKKTVQFF